MRKKILLGLFMALGLAVPAAKAVAQTQIAPETSDYFALHIGLTGHIYCYGDGSDCRVN